MQSASRSPSVASLRPRVQIEVRRGGEVAQLVEHTTENRGVVGLDSTLAIAGKVRSKRVSARLASFRLHRFRN